MPAILTTDNNFLAIPEPAFYAYESSKVVIQQAPYEHTSSYVQGSDKGPEAIINASHFVEFFDEELDMETYKKIGICTLSPIDFEGKVDGAAVDEIYSQTKKLLDDNKFVVSLGAEHTVTLGFVKAHLEKYPDLTVVQIDAHSDLRQSYHDNPYSHASVMARINDLGVSIRQIGIRAQCIEERELIKSSATIKTWFAHQVHENKYWIDECINSIQGPVYLTIDADGFDPSVTPATGTAEPGGLTWNQGVSFLRKLMVTKKVVGFDIVEVAPREVDIITEFSMAKLCYKILGYLHYNKQL